MTSRFLIPLLAVAVPVAAAEAQSRRGRAPSPSRSGPSRSGPPSQGRNDRDRGRPQPKGDAVELEAVRSIDGRGNNLENPEWGAAHTPLLRKAAAAYPGDGSGTTIVEPPDRPNARDVSNAVFAQEESIPNGQRLSDMVWQWGQFLDHDIDLTESDEENGVAPVTDPDDPLVGVIPLTRSNFVEGTSDAPRRQINEITAFIDASNVYGSDRDTADGLREFEGGRMRTSADGKLLPEGPAGFFEAGDVRANEQVGLLAMHTLFVREHNRLAAKIARKYPGLDDETIYQMARKIVGAEMQIVTYREFLPALLGFRGPNPHAGRRYDPTVDPSIANEFSTASYRFGHSMLSPNLLLVDDEGEEEALPLREAFFNPWFLSEDADRVDRILNGLARQRAQAVDAKVVDDVRNFLFGDPGEGGLDLVSLNIQRGRDHGLPDFNTVRIAYGLRPVNGFDRLTTDPVLRVQLAETYESIDRLDPWVGGLAEDRRSKHDAVGSLVATVLAEQFERLRAGDRFFWMRDPDLEKRWVRSIVDLRQVRLSRIIEANTDLRDLPRNVFRVSEGKKSR